MEELIVLFDKVPASTLIRVIISLMAILVSLNAAIIKAFNWLENWRKKRNKKEEEEKSIADIREIKESLDLVCDSLKTILADNLNRKCKYYWYLQYIPEDEFDEFVKEHKAYNNLHGNSTIDTKFEKVITSLEVKSDTAIGDRDDL